MKVVIFAGGIGSRITEESHLKPKPMIEIGCKPILWHLMKIYSSQGFNDFIICLGYKGHIIKEYFLNYYLYNSDLLINVKSNNVQVYNANTEDFKVTLIDTGLDTKTAGRLYRIREHINDDNFFLTYGDGLANINLKDELKFHKNHGKIATMTVVQPDGKYGSLEFDSDQKVTHFKEKPKGDGTWINGGFFILNKQVFNDLGQNSDNIMFEEQPLEELTNKRELMVYKHTGFWKCMDAMRDKIILDELWNTNQAKWKIW